MTQGEFEKIYLGLRKNLMQRSIYRFKIDKDKFIDDCIFQINQSLLFKKAKSEYTSLLKQKQVRNGLTLQMWKRTRFIVESFISKQYPMIRNLTG